MMLAAVGAFVPACGGDPTQDSSWAGTCVRNAELLSTATRCNRDDDCPCGSACDLGTCASACTANKDCASGTVCDSYGRCTLAARANLPIPIGASLDGVERTSAPDGGAARPPVPATNGVLRLERSTIDLLAPTATTTFRISAETRDLERLRVAANPGIEIDCGDGKFVDECRFGPLPLSAGPKAILVRAKGDWPTADIRSGVMVYADTSHLELGVVKHGQPTADVPQRDGVYTGTAWLVGAGMKARTQEDTLPPELARLRLTIRATVFPQAEGKYTVALEDERGTVFPAGAVGTLSVTQGGDTWDLTVPSMQYLGDDVDAPSATALDIHASEQMVAGTFSDGVLSGDIVSRFDGITTAEYAPFARWRISLGRTGPVPAGATKPAPKERLVSNVQTRAMAQFAEEATVQAAIPTFGALVSPSEQAIATVCTPKSGQTVRKFLSTQDRRGDLRCDPDGDQKAFAPSVGALVDRGAYIDDCLAALDPKKPEDTAWDDVAAPHSCASRARAVAAIASALQVDRNRAFGNATTPDLPASRLGTRFLQQWLAMESVTGADPNRIATLGPLLPAGPSLDRLRYYSQYGNAFSALKSSIGAWDVVLHPRVATALAAMSPTALNAPDYRKDFAPNGDIVGGEQTLGLPVNIIATLTSQLEGVGGLVDALRNQRITSRDAQLYAEEVKRFMPRNVVLFAMAQGLRDSARSESTPAWEDMWITSRAKYGVALGKIGDDLRALESNQNALGIEEGDLPLYRLGDQEGVGRRFSAVSDSLLGREDLRDPAIASVLIDQAKNAELLARDSFVKVLERDYETELQAAATDRNVEAMKRHYGEQITSLCIFDDYSTFTVLDHANEIDSDTCFIDPACLPSPEEKAARALKSALSYKVCLFSKFRSKLGDAISLGSRTLDSQVDGVAGSFRADAPLPELSASLIAALEAENAAAPGSRSKPLANLPPNVDSEALLEMRNLCDAAKALSEAARPTSSPASCATTDDCPVGLVCNGKRKECTKPESMPRECYRGSMGEALLAVQAAATELEIAHEELNEYTQNYELALKSCAILEDAADEADERNKAYNRKMSALASIKLAADIAEKAASVAREVIDGGPELRGAFSKGATTALGIIEVASFAVGSSMQVGMDELTREHEADAESYERRANLEVCRNDAEAAMVGSKAAALRVERASQEVFNLMHNFLFLKITLETAIQEGVTAVKAEEARSLLPADVDYWLDDNVDLFSQRMRRARRALYLAVLGVEYELQMSSAERANILAAQRADELETILARLRDSVRRGAPAGGGNPTELVSVLSLRKNILRLTGREGMPNGWQQLGEVERFQRLLVSPEFAVYDAEGTYVGQEIPFSLQPLAPSSLREAAGIPLFSGLSCAERLWSVNASILGHNIMVGSDTSLATLQLRKRNTFQSQWCGTAPSDKPLQVASTRPAQNLFVDPLSASSWGSDPVLTALTNTSEASAFSWATVQARLNVDQRTLEAKAYADGQSTGLAGRGAFGDYTLFIPRTTQSVNGSPGLALERVEDVLIRLDYVAAERQ
jgi:hypothetical protein